MEERFSEKISKFNYSPISSQNLYLQSEVRMLEERLKNLEYLKQTYERHAKEKTSEIENLTRELSEYKSQLYEKNRKLEEISHVHSANESNLLRVIEEYRANKIILEDEISTKSLQNSQFEKNLQQQYEESLKLIDENQELRKELKEKEKIYNDHVFNLEEKLREITISQKITEERVNEIISHTTPKKLNSRTKKIDTSKMTKLYRKELEINKSLKNIITDLYKQKPEELEERLLNSEKKLRKLESVLGSTNKHEFYSPISSFKSTAKLRSTSQSLKNRKS